MSLSREEKTKKTSIPKYATFIISGIAASGAVIFCHPIDVIKNRMQLSGEGGAKKVHKSSFHAVTNIISRDGPLALYDGFSANIARQLCYTMTRLSVFQLLIDKFKTSGYEGLKPQIAASLTAGFVASLIATPTDVILVRMTADRRLALNEQRQYKHVLDAFLRIRKEEGIVNLWAGVIPTVLRALVGNVTQLVTYVQAKSFLLSKEYMKDGIGVHFLASLASGLIYAFSTTPIDVAKTRLQMMKRTSGVPAYKGLADVWTKTIKNEGVTALWKGFIPYYLKIAPNTVLLFIFVEQLNRMYKVYVMKDSNAKGL
ncbi:mitochondrial 2-oxoglutarate/malate carrier protein-like [Cimex lectularius]|uniref:Uncharacterized protein n=1 Tax=Cimex lectularius TaxID=79782 RepID=A0A8I6TEC2_CIMLE|nr:mitochondrial 2-oxoglutarate/malate carrier protein-like [Cimex lectularius]